MVFFSLLIGHHDDYIPPFAAGVDVAVSLDDLFHGIAAIDDWLDLVGRHQVSQKNQIFGTKIPANCTAKVPTLPETP